MAGGKCYQGTLIYGVSGVGKTTQIGEQARWVYDKFGLKTRLVSASGGGWASIDPLVDAGIVIPTFILERKFVYETLNKLSEGYWPEDTSDPTSKLLAPSQQSDWDEFGCLAFEGMTEMADWMMRYSVAREAEGRIRISGQKVAANFLDGEMRCGAPSMGMYNTIQNYIAQYVAQSKAIKDKYILWTALERKVTDENTRRPTYGPEVCGEAKTTTCSAWFDYVLHLYYESSNKNNLGTRRMYLTRHFENGVPFVAKSQMSILTTLPPYLEGDELSMYYFQELLLEKRKQAKEKLIGGKKDE